MITFRAGWIITLAATATVVAAGPASAATLRATGDGYRVTSDGSLAITTWTEGRDLVLVDQGSTEFDRALPDGCVEEPVDEGVGARCDARGEQRLRIVAGDGDTWITARDLPRRIVLDVRVGTGNTVVEGGAGDDRIVGGDGRDTLYGGPGDDLIVGGEGNDYLRGNGGNDEVRGGEGLNFLFGDGGDDVLRGGSGFEYFTGGRGNDVILAGDGADDIGAGAGDDVVFGGGGDDAIRGGSGADRLFGGAGDDLLRARDGEVDTMHCGGGDDVARVDAADVDEAGRSCETVKYADTPVTEPDDLEAMPT